MEKSFIFVIKSSFYRDFIYEGVRAQQTIINREKY